MKVTENMKVRDVLAISDHMLDAFVWLAPQFERLRYPKLRRAMAGRVTVAQAARIAGVPLTEALYLLNLAAKSDPAGLERELRAYGPQAFDCVETNPPRKPRDIANLDDEDERVLFVDVTEDAFEHRDPMPKIAKGLVSLTPEQDILLVRHPFDPIPLRDLFARRGYLSWAEERRENDWYIYFFRPQVAAAAAAGRSGAYRY